MRMNIICEIVFLIKIEFKATKVENIIQLFNCSIARLPVHPLADSIV